MEPFNLQPELLNSKHIFLSLDNYARCDTWQSLLSPPIKSVQLNHVSSSYTIEVTKVGGENVTWFYDTLDEASEHLSRFLHEFNKQLTAKNSENDKDKFEEDEILSEANYEHV
jgi:hypothetical protein